MRVNACILIDDYDKNTSQFTDKGGIGITFLIIFKQLGDQRT